MKILLVGINAKYIHSNLAIRMLKEYAKASEVVVAEYTINQPLDYILSEIFKHQADMLCFSCYLWNIEMVEKLIKSYKKINPATKIVLGGPEVSYDSLSLMERVPEIDYVIYGEGEETFKSLVEYERNPKGGQECLEGLCFRAGEQTLQNPPRKALSMDKLPFVYEAGFDALENRILYYESSRGCPFNCQYCLSSIEKGVRLRPLDLVYKELQFFINHKVMQVKFVDRTFNCNKKHARGIWEWIKANDLGITNFHFEISADLLDDETVTFLNTVRQGLFQFEIGVQSTHEKTLEVIDRKSPFAEIAKRVKELQSGNNIHLHLDLIAGLPYEGLPQFRKSFNDVYQLHPDQLQLGFLKVLKGSGIEQKANTYGILYRQEPPYEVLCTGDLSYQELILLKGVEEMLELFYNSGQFLTTIPYLETFYQRPFDLYEAVATFYEEQGYHQVSHSKIAFFTVLWEFASQIPGINRDFLNATLKMDFCLLEKVKKYPDWMQVEEGYKEEIYRFYKEEEAISHYLPQLVGYGPQQLARMAHMEVFDYDLVDLYGMNFHNISKEKTAVLFNYHDRDKMRHKPRVNKVKII